jgi:hypothetical protein
MGGGGASLPVETKLCLNAKFAIYPVKAHAVQLRSYVEWGCGDWRIGQAEFNRRNSLPLCLPAKGSSSARSPTCSMQTLRGGVPLHDAPQHTRREVEQPSCTKAAQRKHKAWRSGVKPPTLFLRKRRLNENTKHGGAGSSLRLSSCATGGPTKTQIARSRQGSACAQELREGACDGLRSIGELAQDWVRVCLVE